MGMIIVPTSWDGSETDRKLIVIYFCDKYLLSTCWVADTAPDTGDAVVKQTDSPCSYETYSLEGKNASK